MRLKKIEPGMVIHVKNGEEYKELLKEAKRLGYVWIRGSEIVVDREDFAPSKQYIVFHGNNEIHDFRYIAQRFRCENAIEFSDLVLTELTAKEALRIRRELSFEFVREYLGLSYGRSLDEMLRMATVEQVMDMCQQWKADHAKKEPEIETVDICRIIEILPDGKKRCVHEEEIKPELPFDADNDVAKILKRYCMEHDGEFIAVHEVVTRVNR